MHLLISEYPRASHRVLPVVINRINREKPHVFGTHVASRRKREELEAQILQVGEYLPH